MQPIEPTVQARYAALNDPALKALVPQLSVKGGLLFVGKDTDETYKTPKNSFLPRFGFVYRLDPKTLRPRRRRSLRRLPRAAARRRDHVGLLADDDVRDDVQRQRGADPVHLGRRAAHARRSSSRSATRSAGRRSSGQGLTFFNPNPAVSKQVRWQIGAQRELPARLDG